MPKQCLSGKDLSGCGVSQGFLRRESGELYLKGNAAQGYYVSRIYDSGARGTQWNRLMLSIGRNAVIQSCVWVFDRREEGEQADGKRTVKEQYDYVEECAQYRSDYREMLLYGKEGGCGRFARLAVRAYPGGGSGDMVFRGFSMSFPKESFTGYLPELYRGNGQLERFLAVQQSIYLTLEAYIDGVSEKLDPVYSGREQIKRLAGWMGWGELAAQADEKTLRRLLGTGISLQSRKGTGSYYIQLTEILTGEKAYLVEEPEIRRATVLLRRKPKAGKEKLLDWLRSNVPMGLNIRFMVLDKTDRLDGMFFLDVTAALSPYESELTPGGVGIDGIVLL